MMLRVIPGVILVIKTNFMKSRTSPELAFTAGCLAGASETHERAAGVGYGCNLKVLDMNAEAMWATRGGEEREAGL